MRWAGKLAHCVDCCDLNPTYLQPLPVREEAVPTPRPPVGGSEESEQEDQFFREPKR